MTDTMECQRITRERVRELAAAYNKLDAIQKQIAVVKHRRMPQEKLRLDIGDGDYATTVEFTYDHILEILNDRLDAVCRMISAYGGQL